MHISFFVISILVLGVIAAPVADSRPRKHIVREKRHRLPSHWRRNARLHPESTLPMRIGLAQNNLDKAEEYLLDVSHPASLNFGRHWTAKQVAEAFAPSKGAVNAVSAWLMDAGIIDFSPSQSLNWIHANVTVKQAERLLKTTFFQYKHRTGKLHVACEEYSVPEYLSDHVDFITPTIHFDVKIKPRDSRGIKPSVQPGKAKDIGSPSVNVASPKFVEDIPIGAVISELKRCDEFMTPDCLRALYLFPPDFPKADGNSFGIFEPSHQYFVQEDLNQFFANYSPPLVGKIPTINLIDGAVIETENHSFQSNAEADLDLEYAMALAYPQEVTLYQVGDPIEGASFNNFLDAIDGSFCTYLGGDDKMQDASYPDRAVGGYQGPENCGGFAATKVISVSYGYNEVDLSPAYERRQCNEYMKLGLQGVTVLVASGDHGVAGSAGRCIDSSAGNAAPPFTNQTVFNPNFPSTCPYVTSVGATQMVLNQTITDPEVAAETNILSGGGFSNVFPLPDYQKSALESYFAHHKPSYGAGRYNNSMIARGYPDISANGVNYVVNIDGKFGRVSGSSASTPTVGAILTMINSIRILTGKSSIGFINPALYTYPHILNDIKDGRNPGCGTPGFQAVRGWDPVTGLGTPNFPRMAELWLLLP